MWRGVSPLRAQKNFYYDTYNSNKNINETFYITLDIFLH